MSEARDTLAERKDLSFGARHRGHAMERKGPRFQKCETWGTRRDAAPRPEGRRYIYSLRLQLLDGRENRGDSGEMMECTQRD